MSIVLKKGGRFNLTKKDPGMEKIMVGLGWEMKAGNRLDLDVSVFMIGPNGKLPADEYFIFYNNLKAPDNSVEHTGDNRSGAGDGDDEMILANLSAIDPSVSELIFVTSIHDETGANPHFGLLNDAYIRIVDVEKNKEVLRYDLDAEFADCTDVEFGRLERQGSEWFFRASGAGSSGGLQMYVDKYA